MKIILPFGLISAIANELAYNLYIYVFQFLIRKRLNFLYYLKNIIIPEIIFTVVTTLLFYRLFLFISRKLEEMEQGEIPILFKDLLEMLKEFLQKIASSRLVALSVLFAAMFALLIVNLFNLQIIHGEDYLNEYMQKTEKVIYTPGTRGNILDRNGNILAYNELAYSVAVQDTEHLPKKEYKTETDAAAPGPYSE